MKILLLSLYLFYGDLPPDEDCDCIDKEFPGPWVYATRVASIDPYTVPVPTV